MITNEQLLGHCPKGQLESRHIELFNISASSVNEYGIVVGVLPPYDRELLVANGSKNIVPVGITHSTLRMYEAVFTSINIMLFRNKQAIAVKTSDSTVTYGNPVFVDSNGMATQTVSSGWKIGICGSTAVQTNGVGYKYDGLSYILVEMQDLEWVGGA